MNYVMVLKNLGRLLICEAIAMVPALIVTIIYGENSIWSFLKTIEILLLIGMTSIFIRPKNKEIYARDGFAIVAIGWIMVSFFGALPFYYSGSIPSLVDGFFETSSGFTTTGSSILKAVEGLPNGILFWRSFTHWVGGMGVLVLAAAILLSSGAGTYQMIKAESPGPAPGKLVPRVKETAKILYGIYIVFTFLEIILLRFGGMSWFDSMIHTFGSVGTGGFSNRNNSIGAYNNLYIEIIITIFTFLCGANFALYYQVFKGKISSIFKDEEFRIYCIIVITSIILIAFNIYGYFYKSVGQAVRYSSFQVVTIITTTGFSTTDFNAWPTFSKIILFFLMFIGGCAGSTGGGIKNVRLLLLIKSAKRDLLRIIHPRAVYSVKIGEKAINEQTLSEVQIFFFMYIILFCTAVLIVSIEGKDITTTLSAVAATMGNIGPGLEIVGPMGNFSSFTDISKLVLSFCMIAGRLEIYPILLLSSRRFWKKQ